MPDVISEYKFKAGDRIKANKDICTISNSVRVNIPKGNSGTILESDSYIPWVRWDIPVHGMSDASGLCEDGYGTAEHEDDLDSLA